jgi:preprotein translocase subunit SecG
MYTLVVILILIVSVLISLIVLVQNSKGGGLVSNFGGANQMMGVRQTTDFLEKATWTMGGILVVLCLISSITIPKNVKSGDVFDTEMRQQIENMMPTAPATDAVEMEAPAATNASVENPE